MIKSINRKRLLIQLKAPAWVRIKFTNNRADFSKGEILESQTGVMKISINDIANKVR